jgi:hypothetical protein
MMESKNRAAAIGDLAPEVVALILDKLDAGDLSRALESRVFAIDGDAERVRRRCQSTKKRRLVADGDLPALKRIRKKRNARFVLQDVTLAARGGHLDAVAWLYKHASGGYPCRVIQEASAGGHLDVVRWLCDNDRVAIRPGAIDAAVDVAAKYGHNNVINYLATTRSVKGTPVALFWAVRNGHADTIQRLCAISTENAGAYYAARHDDQQIDPLEMISSDDTEIMGVLKVEMVAKDHPHAFGLFDLACLMGRMNIIQWLWKRKLGKWTRHLYWLAAAARGTDVVDFLYAHRSSLEAGIAPDEFDHDRIFAVAALGGSVAKAAAWHFAMLAPVVLSRTDVTDVAARGHLDMIKFLHTKRAPINYRACLLAACEGGSIDVATFMIEAGAIIDEEAIERAARCGRSDIIRLLYARGGDVRVGASALCQAVRYCDANAVSLVRSVGRAPVKSRTLVLSVLRGCPDVMAALCDRKRATESMSAIDYAATVAYAAAHSKFDIDSTLDSAVLEGNLYAIDALLDIRPILLGNQPYQMPDHFCERTHFEAIRRVAARCSIVWQDDDYTINNAVMRGGLDTVRWFHNRGLLDGKRRDQMTTVVPFAAHSGKRSTVEFMWEHGFRPTSMESPPLCEVCDDQPAEDHCAARAFLRQKIAEVVAVDSDSTLSCG